VILSGQLLDHLGACRFTEPIRDPRDPIGWRVRHVYIYEPVELRSVREPCPITDGHGGRTLGLVQHVEITQQGDAWIAGDLVASLPAGDEHGRLYLSAEGVSSGGGQLELTAVAITPRPAMLLAPIAIVSDRAILELTETRTLTMRRTDPHTAGLLERAQTAARRRGPHDALRVHDLRTTATRESADEPGNTPTREPGWVDDSGAQHGPLWTRPSAIVSVRGRPVASR
jgi:hypothetical protein